MFTKRKMAEAALLQRTDLQKVPKIIPKGMHPFIHKKIIAVEAVLRTNQLLRLYYHQMQQDWEQIRQYLPQGTFRLLDIGCGLGGIHAHHDNSPEIWLVDKDGRSKDLYYGFEAQASYYNRLDVTAPYLTEVSGIPMERLHFLNVAVEPLPEQEFDVILSLLSWGFHYPLEEYLAYALGHLVSEGVVIVDCRVGTEGLDLLKRHLDVTVIESTRKYQRVVCRKP